ncbi:MAG TPA: STAS domain-containing protein [Terriglobales bacterium]|nr:STAS domain-containing protein [Terriglobales bacterium]
MNAVKNQAANLGDLLRGHQEGILEEWLKAMAGSTRRADLMKDSELRSQAKRFLTLVSSATDVAGNDLNAAAWNDTKEMLDEISRSRAVQGFTPSETATFVFSLKRPLFDRLRSEYADDPDMLTSMLWSTTELLDGLGLYTVEVFIKTKEETIRRQQEEMLELSTPVVKLWENILALPLIGTLDSARTQVVMESLLQAIVQSNSKVAIIDITGVPTVDTVTAQHLLKTVTAARLMGAECIISGVRPQIAQTIVHLGINLLDVTTKATLADAFLVALKRTGFTFVRGEKREDQK